MKQQEDKAFKQKLAINRYLRKLSLQKRQDRLKRQSKRYAGDTLSEQENYQNYGAY